MFAKILVPLDGSPFAEQALPVAGRLAATCGADVALVRVVELMAPGEREPGVVSYLDEHRIVAAQKYVEQAAAKVCLGRPVSAEAYLAHDIVTGIVARALDAGADLIVLTTHGQSWPAAGALGSVAAGLLRAVPCAVLVVGPRAARAAGQAPTAAQDRV